MNKDNETKEGRRILFWLAVGFGLLWVAYYLYANYLREPSLELNQMSYVIVKT